MADSLGFLVDSQLALSAKDLRQDLIALSVATRPATIRISNRFASRWGSIREEGKGPDEASRAVILKEG